MSPLTGLGVNKNRVAINIPPLTGHNPPNCLLPTAHLLRHSGLRFSMKALTPSLASSVFISSLR